MHPGDRLSVYVGDRGSRDGPEGAAAASVKGRIWGGSESVNAFLQFSFSFFLELRLSPGRGRIAAERADIG
jgi:hypothetical protein